MHGTESIYSVEGVAQGSTGAGLAGAALTRTPARADMAGQVSATL